jgi:hypothetical protein
LTYYAYENWRAGPHTIVVHIGICGFCNDGRGLAGGTRSDNGLWHGPFANLEFASTFAPGIPLRLDRCIRKKDRGHGYTFNSD